jgi:MFS family permease
MDTPAPTAEATATRPSFRLVLQNRAFFWIWASQTLSLSGNFIFAVAIVWLVLRVTGSVIDIGVVTAAEAIPIVVASPLLGVAVDRFDLRKILILSNVGQAGVTAAIVGLTLYPTMLFLLIVVLGILILSTGQTAVTLAIRAALPRMLAVEELGAANALLSISSNSNQIFGYGVGGLVVAALGVSASVEYDGATFLLAAAMVAMVNTATLTLAARAIPRARPTLLADYREGLRYTFSQSWLIQLILLGLVVNFFTSGLVALYAPYVRADLGGGALQYGLLLTSMAVGGAAGAFILGKIVFRKFAGRLQLFCLMAEGSAIVALGLTHFLAAALALGVVIGLSPVAGNVAIGSLLQAQVPKQLIGRISSVASLTLGAGPFGAVIFGYLGTWYPVSSAVIVAGAGVLLGSAVGYAAFTSLKRAAY